MTRTQFVEFVRVAKLGVVAIVDSVQFIAAEPSKEQIGHLVAAGFDISMKLGYIGSGYGKAA